jgi:hypothetical protein
VAARKSRPQRQQGVGQMGSIGGSRFGSGKLRRLVRRVWKGPLAPQADLVRAREARGVTGSVSGSVIRPTRLVKSLPGGFRSVLDRWGGPQRERMAGKPQLASVAPTTPSLGVGDAVRGYPALS